MIFFIIILTKKSSDIPGGVIDSTNLPQTTLREIQSTVNFLTDTWLHANVSGCDKLNEEENDSCIVLKWIKEMKLREQRSHVYNIQIDESNEDTATNTTKAKFIQVRVILMIDDAKNKTRYYR